VADTSPEAIAEELQWIADEVLSRYPNHFTAGCVVPDVRLLSRAAVAIESLAADVTALRAENESLRRRIAELEAR
jgi:hypothetical protein